MKRGQNNIVFQRQGGDSWKSAKTGNVVLKRYVCSRSSFKKEEERFSGVYAFKGRRERGGVSLHTKNNVAGSSARQKTTKECWTVMLPFGCARRDSILVELLYNTIVHCCLAPGRQGKRKSWIGLWCLRKNTYCSSSADFYVGWRKQLWQIWSYSYLCVVVFEIAFFRCRLQNKGCQQQKEEKKETTSGLLRTRSRGDSCNCRLIGVQVEISGWDSSKHFSKLENSSSRVQKPAGFSPEDFSGKGGRKQTRRQPVAVCKLVCL